MNELHRARPGALRRFARHLALVALAGATIIAIFDAARPALLEWARSDPDRARARAQLLLAAVGALVVLPVAGYAVYIWRLGGRILREGRFPPVGMAVIRDVVVIRGDAARSRGRVFQGTALVLLVLACLIGLTLVRLATLGPAV